MVTSGAVDVCAVCFWAPLRSALCLHHVAHVIHPTRVDLKIFFSWTLELVLSSSLLT